MLQKINEEISLKAINFEEKTDVFKIFKACRNDLSWVTGFSVEEQENHLRTQFEIEKQQFSMFYPNAQYYFILLSQETIGRLYMNYGEKDNRILDIGVLGTCRQKGIGSAVISRIIKEAEQQKKTVSLQVVWFNEAALKFYLNLGFSVVENRGITYEMQYTVKF